MAGMLDEDLKPAIRIDGEGVPCQNVFRFRNRDWNSWRMPDGPEVLVSEEFRSQAIARGRVFRRGYRARWSS